MSEDSYEITWLVRRLFRAMASHSNERLRSFDITAADRAVLEFLYPDEWLSVPDIAARYDVSRQHVQVTVNRLVDKGLVTTEDNPRHKRSPLIVLTTAGRNLFSKVIRGDKELVKALFGDIPASNLRTTRRTLGKVLHKLNEGEFG